MRFSILVCCLVGAADVACERATADSVPAPGSASSVAATKVARIVFIDKAEACECTKNRIDGSWTALQAALGTPAGIPVERIHMDTEAVRAEQYTTYKPLMVPPGIYFLGVGDSVTEMLQGEVSQEQIAAVLKGT
jgi:hypothetical protein